jgi:hypothetical protein
MKIFQNFRKPIAVALTAAMAFSSSFALNAEYAGIVAISADLPPVAGMYAVPLPEGALLSSLWVNAPVVPDNDDHAARAPHLNRWNYQTNLRSFAEGNPPGYEYFLYGNRFHTVNQGAARGADGLSAMIVRRMPAFLAADGVASVEPISSGVVGVDFNFRAGRTEPAGSLASEWYGADTFGIDFMMIGGNSNSGAGFMMPNGYHRLFIAQTPIQGPFSIDISMASHSTADNNLAQIRGMLVPVGQEIPPNNTPAFEALAHDFDFAVRNGGQTPATHTFTYTGTGVYTLVIQVVRNTADYERTRWHSLDIFFGGAPDDVYVPVPYVPTPYVPVTPQIPQPQVPQPPVGDIGDGITFLERWGAPRGIWFQRFDVRDWLN